MGSFICIKSVYLVFKSSAKSVLFIKPILATYRKDVKGGKEGRNLRESRREEIPPQGRTDMLEMCREDRWL